MKGVVYYFLTFFVKDKNIVNYQFKSPYLAIANLPKSATFHTKLGVWDCIRTELSYNLV